MHAAILRGSQGGLGPPPQAARTRRSAKNADAPSRGESLAMRSKAVDAAQPHVRLF